MSKSYLHLSPPPYPVLLVHGAGLGSAHAVYALGREGLLGYLERLWAQRLYGPFKRMNEGYRRFIPYHPLAEDRVELRSYLEGIYAILYMGSGV